MRRSWPALGLAALLAAGGLLVLTLPAARASNDPPSEAVLALFVLAMIAAAQLQLDYSYRGELVATNLFEAALALTIFTLTPAWVVLLAGVAMTVSEALHRVPPVKAVFNVCSWLAASAVGALTFAVLTPDGERTAAALPALVAAVAATQLVSLAALVLAIATTLPIGGGLRRRWFRSSAPRLVRDTALPGLVNLVWSVLFVATYSWASWTLALFVVPLAMLHWANRGYALGRAEQARLLGLQRATHALAADPDLDTALPMFLAETSATFGWEVVEVVLPTPDGRTVQRHRVGATPVYSRRTEQAHDCTAAALLLECGGSIRSAEPPGLRALLDREGWLDAVCAPLTVPDRDRPLGLLCAYDRSRATAFPERDVAAIEALAAELAGVLARADMHRTVLEERAKLEQIVRDTADGIATLGRDGCVQTWNPAFERISGYPAAAVLGRSGMSLLRPVDGAGRPVIFEQWSEWQQDADGLPPEELSVRCAGRQRRWLSCSYSRASDPTGAGTDAQLVVVARDVTALRLARRRREAEAAVFEQIAAGAPLPVVLRAVASSVSPPGSGLECAVLLRPPAAAPAGAGRQGGAAARQLSSATRQPGAPGREAGAGLQVAAATDDELFEALLADSTTSDRGWAGAALRSGGPVHVTRDSAVAPAPLDDEPAAPAAAPVGRSALQAAPWLSRTTLKRLLALEECWAVPVRGMDNGGVLGAVAVVADCADAPDAPEAELLRRVGDLVAIAVERRRTESRLTHLATHDTVTGLPNRVVFLDRCQHALDRARRDSASVVVLFLDLDRFKVVNDSLGHDSGDRLLVACAQRLATVLRPGDTVARFGGDEFTILCDGTTDERHIAGLTRRIQAALADPFPLGDGEVYVTASIGIAVSNGGGTADALVGDADAAMYRAKEHGGNRWELFDAAMRARATERMTTQSALHRGLERGEFEVHYQPIVSLPGRAVTSAEALLRWRHPDRGLLLPGDYISQAESSGLIVPIGRHVIRTACLQARRWQRSPASGRPQQLSINLSAREFVQPDLIPAIADALDSSGADPAGISFEITESAAMDDAGATVAAMHELKSLGVGLTIDDFGTGYSSLTYLKRFPVNGLKVDQSFVAGLGHDNNDGAIVAAVIELAHSLGLRAVAEGVETEEQLQQLRALGCDAAQGFHLGRPQPAGRF